MVAVHLEIIGPIMKTRVCRLYGQNDLRVEASTVSEPQSGEVMVKLAFGGICGSDMHYLSDGGIGTIRVKEPIILGHEASGEIVSIGPNVHNLNPNDKIAINPSRPCGTCKFCTADLQMHCLDMRFNGSAIRIPHEQGLFRDLIILKASQCIKVPPETNLTKLACAEPLAVCMHAAKMSGSIKGKRVLVTGAGPIGSLCTAVAAAHGATEIVVTDIFDETLNVAKAMGATQVVNVATNSNTLNKFQQNKGHFDIAFECSAVASAIATAVHTLLPRGILIQVGVAGDTPLPINAIVAKEIKFQGTYRFHDEFSEAVAAIASGDIDVSPMITGVYQLDDVQQAFEAAMDRRRSVKVHLKFN
jgi:L-idonate 5-dehydrogenase